MVRAFVKASEDGWRYAIEHPDEAAQILTTWAKDTSVDFQKLAVRAVAPLVDTPQVPDRLDRRGPLAAADGRRLRLRPPGLHHAVQPGHSVTGGSRGTGGVMRSVVRPQIARAGEHHRRAARPLPGSHRGAHRGRHQRRVTSFSGRATPATGWSASSSRWPPSSSRR